MARVLNTVLAYLLVRSTCGKSRFDFSFLENAFEFNHGVTKTNEFQ